MGGGRSQVNKAHKTRFASKASRHAHKIGTASPLLRVHPFRCFPRLIISLFAYALADKVRSGKPESSHRAAVKGARAARIQQSKAVGFQFNTLHIFFCPF
jgi:pre-rRNA-processing protein TSR1